MTQSVDDFIAHHGVRGMKWGVRRKPAPRTSNDYKRTAKLRNRKTSELSNRQLSAINNRRQLETKYNQMNPSKVTRGHNAVRDVLAVAGTASALFALSQSPAGKALISLGKKKVNQQLKLF